MAGKEKLIIRHRWALGDTVLLTALVRDIHRAYPDKYEIKVDTHYSNVWWHNPHVSKFEESGKPAPLKAEVSWGDAISWNAYAKFGKSKEMRHILAWYHYDFERKTGIHVPVTDPKPDLHLSPEERAPRISGRYWVILSGGKLDVTVKHWHAHRAQEVVDKLVSKGINVVQVGAVNQNHIHPPLENVTNLVGKTENARDLWNLILHSDGVICGVTAAMHIAAAFDRPCVVYGGGREEPWFEAYVDNFKAFGPSANPVKVPHKYLHTIGLLDCCKEHGCWKKRTVPLDPADLNKKAYTLCQQPVRPEDSHAVPKCQDLITSEHVVRAVMDYYDKNVLPPIDLDIKETKKIEIPKCELVVVKDGNPVSKKVEYKSLTREPSTESREQKAYHKTHPLEVTPISGPVTGKLEKLDDPILGGKITVCVLCYGPHAALARRCLSGIISTIPASKLDLRVATNEAEPATLEYLRALSTPGGSITKLYEHPNNDYKYPVMREMLWDESLPISTNYFLWFDDDTWIVDQTWLDNLCTSILKYHKVGGRLYGNLLYHDLSMYNKSNPNAKKWFESGVWWRDKPLRTKNRKIEGPNGSIIDFAVGWCWAMSTAAMREANIPDVRLGHNGGDITIGEQIHQAGYSIIDWNKGKSLVACPSREQGGRRGYSEHFPWSSQR